MAEEEVEILKRIGTGQALQEGTEFPSPFTKVLALGFHDGPTNGLIETGYDAKVYAFHLVDELLNPEADVRIFSLAPLPATALTRLTEALSRFMSPRWPLWVPVWRFPSAADKEAMERVADEILDEASAVTWLIACADLTDTIVAAKAVLPGSMPAKRELTTFLGLGTALPVVK